MAILEKISKMMDETLFWEIIGRSLENTKNQDQQERYLVNEVEKLDLPEIIGFRLRTEKLLDDTYNSEMWCAAYIINGGCSDDGFEYFRSWLISRGKSVYYAAKENPDSLVNEVSEDEEYEFESFQYIANDAFENRTGQDIQNHIDYNQLLENESESLPLEFNWEEDNPESMRKICPRLFHKLGDH